MVNLTTPRRTSLMTPFATRFTRQGNDLPNLMRRLFGEDFDSSVFAQPVSWVPAVEVTETDKDIMVVAELPGLTDKDVEISFDDDVLTISGEKTEEKTEDKDNKRFHLWERSYGSFRRSFTLPSNVDADRINADFKNGILTIKLPKTTAEKSRGRKIPIAASK